MNLSGFNKIMDDRPYCCNAHAHTVQAETPLAETPDNRRPERQAGEETSNGGKNRRLF